MFINKFQLVLSIILISYILIIAHELVHYSVSKYFNLPVEEVSFGYGPKWLTFKVKETRFNFGIFFFGGYNKQEVDFKNNPLPRILSSISAPLMNIFLGLFMVYLIIPGEFFSLISLHHGISFIEYSKEIVIQINSGVGFVDGLLFIPSLVIFYKILIVFTGLMSFMIGLLNIIPIPPLDGGNFMFHLSEVFIKPEKREQLYFRYNSLGIYFIVALNLLIFFSQG